MTTIYELSEYDGAIRKKAEYSLPPKKALVCYIQQCNGNFNTWEYPDHLPGMRESKTVPDHWYYDDIENRRVVAAYPWK